MKLINFSYTIYLVGFIEWGSAEATINRILPSSRNVLCPGFPVDGYHDRFNVIRFHMRGVRVIKDPVECYWCGIYLQIRKLKYATHCTMSVTTARKYVYKYTLVLHMLILIFIYDTCQVYSHVTQQAETSDEKARSARCNCSSNYSWSKLSPGSQLKRRSSLVKERQIYMKRASTVFEHTGKLLCLGLHW